MAKKTTPIITHTEILARAIRSVESEIEGRKHLCESLPPAQREAMFKVSTEELRGKIDTLKQMYLIETGTEYV